MAENIYQEYERIGREQFKSFCDSNPQIWNLQFTEGAYDRYDAKMYSGYSLIAVEIKKRKHPHDMEWKGEPSGFIFEKVKYDGLKATDSDEQFFVTIFEDAVVIWNITNLNPKWITRKYASNHTRQMKMDKEVTYLKLEEASHIIKIK